MDRSEHKSVGERIRFTREKNAFSIDALAEKAGCSTEYLEWVENGQVDPPVALLIRLAKSLHMDIGAFIQQNEDPREQRRSEAFKRTKHYSYKPLTPTDEDSHLMAFSITIPPHTVHEGVGYQHEGEEYLYVLSGSLEVMLDAQKRLLMEKDSLRFNSYLEHRLSNPGDIETELLVVLYTP